MLPGPPSITRPCAEPSSGHRSALPGSEGVTREDRSDTRFKAQEKNPCQDLNTGTSGSRRFAVEHHVRSRSPAELRGCPGTDLLASLLSAAGRSARLAGQTDGATLILASITPP